MVPVAEQGASRRIASKGAGGAQSRASATTLSALRSVRVRFSTNRAIRRSGSRDYWKLRRFLPRETRHYVPNYIAAVYLMTYHHLHGMAPSYMELDLQITALFQWIG